MTNLDTNGGGANLPVSQEEILRNMRAAVPARSLTGGSRNYVRIDRNTGEITFGRDDTPWPLNHLYAVPWREVAWGYKEFSGRTALRSIMQPIVNGSCPMPAGDFAPFGVDGPRACMELKLCSLQEPGFAGIYSCLNESGSSRILDLWGEIAAQFQDNPKFANPVVATYADNYTNQYGTTHCLAYRVKDWVADDGATLLSKTTSAAGELPF